MYIRRFETLEDVSTWWDGNTLNGLKYNRQFKIVVKCLINCVKNKPKEHILLDLQDLNA